YYDAIKRETKICGPQHVIVSKEGHDLEARELHISEQQGIQRMTAFGPGVVKLFDKAAKEQSNTATWQDQLTTNKDGDQDLFVLTGRATFNDTEHQQYLTADKLKVWLEPTSRAPGQPPAPQDKGQSSRRPQRVEATGHVVTRSAEMSVHDTDT